MEEFVGSCLSCDKKCLEPVYKNLDAHPSVHIKYPKENFTKKIKDGVHLLQTNQLTEKSKNFKADLLEQLELLLKYEMDQDIMDEYCDFLCNETNVPAETSKKMERVAQGSYDKITCCDIAQIEKMHKNLIIKKARHLHEAFLAQYILKIQKKLMDISYELSKRYLVHQALKPVQEVKVQKKQSTNKEKTEEKMEKARSIKEEDSSLYMLINKAKQHYPQFTIRVSVLNFYSIPDNRFKVNVEDESGKGVLILPKNDKIYQKKKKIIVDKCRVVPYQGEKQIRADKSCTIKYSEESNPYASSQSQESSSEKSSSDSQDVQQFSRPTRKRIERQRALNNRIQDNYKGITRVRKAQTEMTPGRERERPSYTKIKDIDPGDNNLNLQVKVVKIKEICPEKNEIDCILGDETGIVNADLPYELDFIQEDENLIIYSVVAEVVNEHIRMTTLDEDFMLEDEIIKKTVITRARSRIPKINMENNISEKAWVEDDDD